MNRKRMFQHAAARRRLGARYDVDVRILRVSTRSRPKAAGIAKTDSLPSSLFQHAAARRRLDDVDVAVIAQIKVSTRSRPKAAGLVPWLHRSQPSGFNTQPPEGGWSGGSDLGEQQPSFNTQPPEGGWLDRLSIYVWLWTFQHAAARRRLGDNKT